MLNRLIIVIIIVGGGDVAELNTRLRTMLSPGASERNRGAWSNDRR